MSTSSLKRTGVVCAHLHACAGNAASSNEDEDRIRPATQSETLPPTPPVVKATREFSTDPVKFLMEAKAKHPEAFSVDRGGHLTTFITDPSLFDDILSDEEMFNPDFSKSMPTNHNVFQIPKDKLEKFEGAAIKTLKREVKEHDEALAAIIGTKLTRYMHDHLGAEGEMDLKDLGIAVFWPMTEALFGDGAAKEKQPEMFRIFDEIDSNFPKAIRGKRIPEVVDGVSHVNGVFRKMLDQHHADPSGCPVGPILGMYDRLVGHEEAQVACQFATSAWWGGQGNTVPATMWTFGMILANPEWRRMAYEEVDTKFTGPDADGKIAFEQLDFLTASLRETLRLKTFSIAWRLMNTDTVVKHASGKQHLLKKGSAVGLHWVLRHMDPAIYADPHEFRPTRFLSGREENLGTPYSFAPFSAGVHKCSGYSLAILEIPVVLAYMLREYDMTLLDPLPSNDWSSSFGVVGASDLPTRVRYKKRS